MGLLLDEIVEESEDLRQESEDLLKSRFEEAEELLQDSEVFPRIDVDKEISRLTEDPLVGYISDRFRIKRDDVLTVKNYADKMDQVDRLKLIEQAALLKSDFGMNNYVRNAALIQKYGYESVREIAKSAEKPSDVYFLDSCSKLFNLNNEDMVNIAPSAEQVREVLEIAGGNAEILKAYDHRGEPHFYISLIPKEEIGKNICNITAKEFLDFELSHTNLDQRRVNGRFKILYRGSHHFAEEDDMERHSGLSRIFKEMQTQRPQTTISKENYFDGDYRNDILEEKTGIEDVEGPVAVSYR